MLSKDFKTNSLNTLYALSKESLVIMQSKLPGVSPKKVIKKLQNYIL